MTLTATALRNNIYEVLNNTVKYNDVVSVTTKEGTAIIISEEDYRALLETMYLNSIPGLATQILDAASKPITEGIPASEVDLD